MTTCGYVLTAAAEADLREIIRYTRTRWGVAQARRYIASMEHGIADLAAGRGAFRDMSTVFPELRVAHCDHHYVFCLPQARAPALVVAIFHGRTDLMTRVAGRLHDGI